MEYKRVIKSPNFNCLLETGECTDNLTFINYPSLALSPSSPFFDEADGKSKPAECRLDKTDAIFVDAIHGDRPSERKVTMGMGNPVS